MSRLAMGHPVPVTVLTSHLDWLIVEAELLEALRPCGAGVGAAHHAHYQSAKETPS